MRTVFLLPYRFLFAMTGTLLLALLLSESATAGGVLPQSRVEIEDCVENMGDAPAPLMHLHHINFGYPLVHEGVELLTSTVAAYPMDANARRAQARRTYYDGASAQRPEEVYFHHVRAAADGTTLAALVGDDFGVQVEWDAQQAPYLTQWKNFRQSMYLNGIEPGNCLPEGMNRARREGRLVKLAPGAARTMRTRIGILADKAAVQAARQRVATLDAEGVPVDVHLSDYAT